MSLVAITVYPYVGRNVRDCRYSLFYHGVTEDSRSFTKKEGPSSRQLSGVRAWEGEHLPSSA